MCLIRKQQPEVYCITKYFISKFKLLAAFFGLVSYGWKHLKQSGCLRFLWHAHPLLLLLCLWSFPPLLCLFCFWWLTSSVDPSSWYEQEAVIQQSNSTLNLTNEHSDDPRQTLKLWIADIMTQMSVCLNVKSTIKEDGFCEENISLCLQLSVRLS